MSFPEVCTRSSQNIKCVKYLEAHSSLSKADIRVYVNNEKVGFAAKDFNMELPKILNTMMNRCCKKHTVTGIM